jgi:Zn-dependent protease with chaperone function
MKKRILDYRRRIESILAQGGRRDWQALREEHLAQISFFQHERLVHLLVTALFAVVELFATLLMVLTFSPAVLALFLAVLVLLVPYIAYYFFLENEVQKLYGLYDRIREHCEKDAIA